MGKRGPKPSSEEIEQVGVKMPTVLKQRLIRAMTLRKAADPTLPLRWGLSDYIREALLRQLEIDEKTLK
jgi:hypothetical protein